MCSSDLNTAKELGINFFFEVRGSVICAEDHERFLCQLQPFKFIQQDTAIVVESTDHRCVCGAWGEVRSVSTTGGGKGRVSPALLQIGCQIHLRYVQSDMGQCGGEVQEEWSTAVLLEEADCSITNTIGRVVDALKLCIALWVLWISCGRKFGVSGDSRLISQWDPFAILPQVVRVVTVSMSLAVIAEEMIEALIQWIPITPGTTETPFPECSGHITLLFQHSGQREFIFGDGQLAFRLGFAVIANPGLTGVFSGHQNAAGRSTDGIAGVVAGQPHSSSSQSIEVWGANFLLSEASKLLEAEIVGEYQDDVWSSRDLLGKSLSRGAAAGEGKKQAAEPVC